MDVSMGVGLFPTESPARMRELTHLAERLGYEHVWFGDSQNIWRESYVNMGAAAVGTERIVFGTGVTNGVTRHPSVLASAWATLHELTGGRVVLGIGTGDSSLRTMGLKPMKLAELEAYVETMRTLFRGEEAKEPATGDPFRLNYLPGPIDVPIYIAASAPKILKLTGRIADGCVMLVGTDPNFIRGGLERIAAGAEEAGRDPGDLKIILWTPTAIDEDGTRARDLVRAHVSRVVIRPLPFEVPEEDMEAVERIRESYDYYHHMDTEASHADLVPDSLVDRFALAGTPEECRARVAEIADLGIDQLAIIPFTPPGGDRGRTMELFAGIVQD
jgi:5,10-methylenetetrahydromethanopterin reductase